MFINKNTISIVLLYIGILVSFTSGQPPTTYDAQKPYQYQFPPAQQIHRSPELVNHQGYVPVNSQGYAPVASKLKYPDVVKQPYPYVPQKPYPYAPQKPYPYAPQKPYPYAPQERHHQDKHINQDSHPVKHQDIYHNNMHKSGHIRQDSHPVKHHDKYYNNIHKSGQQLVAVKYSSPIITQEIYQPWNQKHHNTYKPRQIVYKPQRLLHNSRYRSIPHKQKPVPIVFGISLPRLLSRLFPSYIPVMGIETYKLTVHRYPLFLVKPNNSTK